MDDRVDHFVYHQYDHRYNRLVPRFPVNRSDMGVTVYEIPTGCDHRNN